MSQRIKALWREFDGRPEDDATFSRLFRALNEQREHEQLAELYRRRAEVVDDEQAVYLYLTVADVWSQRLGMPGLATEALFAACERAPQLVLLRDRLHQHLEAESDWNMYARFITMELRHASDPLRRGRLQLGFGHLLYRRLHDASEAARMYLEAAGSSELRGSAVLALRRLNHAQPNYVDVSRALEALTGQSSEVNSAEIERLEQVLMQTTADAQQQRAALLGQLASVMLVQPDKLEGALTRIEQSVECDRGGLKNAQQLLLTIVMAVPDNVRALRKLIAVVQESPQGWKREQWEALLEVIELGPILADDITQRFDLLMLLAQVRGYMLDDPPGAAQIYLRAAATDRDREHLVQDALAKLLEHSPQAHDLQDALRELLTVSQRPDALVDYWQRLTVLADSEAERAEALWSRGWAQLKETPEDEASAVQALRQAIATASEASALQFEGDLLSLREGARVSSAVIGVMRLLAARFGRWEALAELLRVHAEHLEEPQAQANAYSSLGDVLAEQLQQPEAAIAALEKAAEAQPHTMRHVSALRHLLSRLGRNTAALQVISKEMHLATHPGERCQLLLDRAQIERALKREVAVAMTFGELLLIRPNHPRGRLLLVEHFSAERGDVLLEALLELKVSPLARHPHAQRFQSLGRALLGFDATRAAGFALLMKAFQIAPARFDGLDAFKVALEQEGRTKELEAIEQWLEENPKSKARGRGVRALGGRKTPSIASLRLEFERAPNAERFERLESHLQRSNDQLALADLYVWASDRAEWLDLSARLQILDRAEQAYEAGGATHNQMRWVRDRRKALEVANADASTRWVRQMSAAETGPKQRQEALDSLLEHHMSRGSWEALEADLTTAIRRAQDPHWRLFLQWHLAELLRVHLDDPDRALEIAQQLIAQAPEQPEYLILYASVQGDAETAVATLEPLLRELSQDYIDGLTPPLRLQFARLQWRVLGDWTAALESYHTLLLKVDEPFSEEVLGRLCFDLVDPSVGSFEQIVDVLLELLDALIKRHPPLPALPHLLRVRARLLTRERDEAERTEQAWLELLEYMPGDSEGLIALAQMCELREDWPEAVRNYESYLEAQLEPQERAAVHMRLGHLLDEYFDAATRAQLHYKRAFEIDPENAEARARLDSSDASSPTAAMLAHAPAAPPPLPTRASAAPPIPGRDEQRPPPDSISTLRERVEDEQQAAPTMQSISALEALIERDPFDEDALRQLETICRELNEHGKLVEALGRRAGLANDDDQAKSMLFERATLLANELGDPSGAIAAHQELLDRFPQYVPSLESLAELYKRLGHFTEAVEILPQLIQAMPERRPEVLREIAGLLEVQLDRPEEAFQHFRLTHELLPDDPGVLRSLWTLANQHGLWEPLIEVLDDDIARSRSPHEQVLRLREVATIAEQQLEDPFRAFHTLRMAFQLTPSDESLLEELERLAGQGGFWQDLAVVYRTLADIVEDPEHQIQHLHDLATLTVERLENPVAAFDVLSEALTINSDHARTLARLDEMAAEHGLWEARLEANVERLSYTFEVEVQSRILVESAELYLRELDDPENAIEFLLRAWVLSPDNAAIEAQLIKLCGGSERLGQRVVAFTAEISADAAVVVWEGGMRLRAEAQERFLEAGDAAFDTLRGALEATPNSDALFAALLQLALRLDRSNEVIRALDAVVASIDSDPLRAPWIARRARAEQLTGDLDAAERSLKAVLEVIPDDEAARAQLEAVRRARAQSTRSHRRQPPPREATGEGVAEEIQTLTRDLPSIRDPHARAERFWAIAQLQRDAIGDLERCETSLRRALSEAPDHYEVARDLADILFELKRFDEACRVFVELLKVLDGDTSRKTFAPHRLEPNEREEDSDLSIFALRRARCLERESRFREALAAYDQLAEQLTDHPAVTAGRARCLYKTGNWSEARPLLAELVAREAFVETFSPKDLAEILYAHGDLLYGARQLAEAHEALERALEFDPSFRAAADQALAALIEQKRWSETPKAFQRLLSMTTDPEVQGAIHKRLGEVHEYFLNQPQKAIVAYEQAVVLGGDTDDVPPRLLRLYVRHQAWEKAHVIAEILLERAPIGTQIRTDLLLVLGDILNKGLGRNADALDIYYQALDTDPTSMLALERIGTLFGEGGNLEAIHTLYTQFIKDLEPKDLEARVSVLGRYGQLLQSLGQSPSEGLEVFKSLADLVPDDVAIHTELFNLFTGEDGTIRNPIAELVHLRKLIGLGEVKLEYLERILDLYQSLNEEEGVAEIKTLLAIVHGNLTPLEDAPATPRAEFTPGAIAGPMYEQYIADPYAVGPLAHFFEQVVEIGLGELKQDVELSGMMTVQELTRLASTPAAERFHRLGRALGLGQRRLFLRSDLDSPYQVFASNPPSIALSEQLVRGRSENDWRFILARTLELSRPRFLLATSLGPFSFLTILRTLLKELSSDHRDVLSISLIDNEAEERVQRFLEELRTNRSIEVQEDFQSLADQILAAPELPSAKQYVMAARTTSVRVGLLACNDQRIAFDYVMQDELGTSLSQVHGPDSFLGFVSRSSDLLALVSYIISEEYLQTRRALKLPRTELSSLIRLPPREPSVLTPALSMDPAPNGEEGGGAYAFGTEIDDLIEALPLDEMSAGGGNALGGSFDLSSPSFDDLEFDLSFEE